MAKTPKVFETAFAEYTRDRQLGAGGAGTIYLVRNKVSEEFALKLLSPGNISTERRKRFKNEVWFCIKSRHKNIIQIIDYGLVKIGENECPFYVMPVANGTLRDNMKNLRAAEKFAIFREVLDGVEAAHLKGVHHRDLKPENILIFDEVPVIADFGIAHFKEEYLLTAVETSNSSRLANFQYSAPEQRIRDGKVDSRADIFALGLILNEMFTGKIPQGEGYSRIAEYEPEYAFLDDVVAFMIQHDASKRPQTVEKLKTELSIRSKQFIAHQKLNELQQEVVPVTDTSSDPLISDPIKIVDVDYRNGQLILGLSQSPNRDWISEFQNPRRRFSAPYGAGPERYTFLEQVASVHVHEQQAQDAVDSFKKFVQFANENYLALRKKQAEDAERKRKQKLAQQMKNEEARQRVLSSIKL